METLISELFAEQNRLLNLGTEYQIACKNRGNLSDKKMQDLCDEWVGSIDDLYHGATNILRWQSQAEDVKRYCEDAKKLIKEAKRKEEQEEAQKEHERKLKLGT